MLEGTSWLKQEGTNVGHFHKYLAGAGTAILATALLSTSALATGFNTEGVNQAAALFNYKSFVVQGSAAFIDPQLRYRNGVGTDQSGGAAGAIHGSGTAANSDAAVSFRLYSGDIKVGFNDNLDCAVRGHQPWNLRNEVSSEFVGRYEQSKFFIDSVGIDGTCSIKFPVTETGLLRIIGGVRAVDLSAERDNFVIGAVLNGSLIPAAGASGIVIAPVGAADDVISNYDLGTDGYEYGYRAGVSFEIPQFLMRIQVIYDSPVSVSLSGQQNFINTADGTTIFSAPVTTEFDLPQSVSARFQTGINETTLVWAGVKWQDWSTIQSLDVTANVPGAAVLNGFLMRSFATGWVDGWTGEIGAAKKLTDDLGVSLSLTYNTGIGDGYNDTWSGALGFAYDMDENWRISIGGSATYLTSSTEVSLGDGGGASSSTYNQGPDWAFAAGIRLQYAIDQ